MVNPFEELKQELSVLFRSIVREEIRAANLDKNAVDKTRYLTVDETADYLDCTVHHVYKLKHRIPHIHRGGRLYFSTEDLRKYMEAGKSAPMKRVA